MGHPESARGAPSSPLRPHKPSSARNPVSRHNSRSCVQIKTYRPVLDLPRLLDEDYQVLMMKTMRVLSGLMVYPTVIDAVAQSLDWLRILSHQATRSNDRTCRSAGRRSAPSHTNDLRSSKYSKGRGLYSGITLHARTRR